MLVLTICKPRTSNECRYDEWNSAELQEERFLFGLYEKILYQIITVIFELQVGIFSIII